ncbi:MAG: LPS export ABC transporter periplasmic protein LptC [Gammaproteobacteria bacterium]
MSVRNALLLAVLAAIAVIAWYAGIDNEKSAVDADAPPPIQSGYYILDALIYGGSNDTRGVFEITAAQAQQSMRGEPILLTDIEILYVTQDEQQWRIEARTAALEEATQKLEMAGNVVATRVPADGGITFSMKTQALAFDPASDVVTTDANVEFLVGRSRLEALGMRATLSEDSINLRSNVRGQYTP